MKLQLAIGVVITATIQVVVGSPVARFDEIRDAGVSKHLRPVLEKRDGPPQFTVGEPIDGKGKGAPISGKEKPI